MPRRKDDLSGLMFAPAVVWARMPILWYEAMNPDPSRRIETNRMVAEKIAATHEGMVATQMAMATAAFDMGMSMLGGASPQTATERAARKVMRAGLAPAARRVKANARRLTGA